MAIERANLLKQLNLSCQKIRAYYISHQSHHCCMQVLGSPCQASHPPPSSCYAIIVLCLCSEALSLTSIAKGKYTCTVILVYISPFHNTSMHLKSVFLGQVCCALCLTNFVHLYRPHQCLCRCNLFLLPPK